MQQVIFTEIQSALKATLECLKDKNYNLSNALLLVVGRDSLPFARDLAQILKLPMEFLFTQIITSPLNAECPIAIVSEDMDIVMNEELVSAFGISLDYIYGEAQRKYEEAILPMRYQFRKGEGLGSLENKDILLFDLGMETGLRMGVAIKTCMNLRAKSIHIIAPIMPRELYTYLGEICDDVCCPYPLEHYISTAHYFPTLLPLDDEGFEQILDENLKSHKQGD